MNILCDTLPNFIELDGDRYEINTDFKVWLKFHSVLTDKSLSSNEKFVLIMLNCFDCEKCKKLPQNAESTLNALLDFYGGNKKSEKAKKKSKSKKLFDFCEDAELIFSAFYMEYGIDLTTAVMHWYKFLALLSGLTERTQFVKILSYRGINLDEIEDKKRRSFYAKMKKIYALSDENAVIAEDDIAQKLSELF